MTPSNTRQRSLRQKRRRRGKRRGVLLVAVIVCMAVVMGIVGTLLRSALSARRQLRVERDLRQVELLLEAGVDRAVAKLAANPNYDGETWSIPAMEILSDGDGEVVIEFPTAELPTETASESEDEAAASRRVRIAAEYPVGGLTAVRRTRTFVMRD